MGTQIELTASDGATISAYRADPAGKPRGGLIVCQEIFGVNVHVRGVCDRYAQEGYLAIAPAFFDRIEPGVELGYEPDDIAKGRGLMQKASIDNALKDVAAAMAVASEAGKVGIVGYCWGGTVAWAAAGRLDGLSAAIPYYGGGIAAIASQKPRIPTMAHFAENDHSIPMTDVEKIRAAQPEVIIHTYVASHGFNCEMRGAYDKPSADLALARSLEFLRQHVG
ncbi:dienelactone hydrolase family protein [Pigmentiphaga sp.]|uniref:dienelactone hydrolase family protein n=1 Tax=Pigmentiphaga sp. TaxID=1977564 RepID=UPI00128E81D2|nr:dienelactone hydrolase family protein [Pigmentiphaga sp.]MPS27069.1 dienelactone hydrolase family protein [Alcaligenaceae bacterium SAGV5]MPS51818.1 dienelactone hydrolase family protein [Alcaligenaceae bacterium SAGV3]MPT58484.1 dienelactone hydrolase family protein [Alcaligenaceae bacterium]